MPGPDPGDRPRSASASGDDLDDIEQAWGATTPGLVCAHHHLYSALARGMPPPPKDPTSFHEILENVWWRIDRALDHDMIEWSAKLAALEALEAGCTAIIDHHESPEAIEGSLTVIADACNEVGVRVSTCYGITDRHGPDGARRGLAENDRYLSELRAADRSADPAAEGAGMRRGMVGVHAAFTCTDDQLAAAAELAESHGVGVHVHVAEGIDDVGAPERIRDLTRDDWLLIHGVHLPDDHGLRGTIVHNPRSNMNNSVGYADPSRFANPVALGTDGIGADMFSEFQIAHLAHRAHDVSASPESSWSWLQNNQTLFAEAGQDLVRWSYEPLDAWHVAFTPTINALEVHVGGRPALIDGVPTRVDAAEIRAKAGEQAVRLHRALRS
ncbi:amidohydrolase family protein [Ilumatobacter sp.]|uniref:amidohydrolase family protein n=1 Tax=Ilumatobacter sp. TaxID=1967498 RepID=UPI003B522FB0